MMDIMPALAQHMSLIESYGNGGFTVNQKRYDGAVLVLPETVLLIEDTDITITDGLLQREQAEALCDVVLAHAPDTELVILGTGTSMQPLDEQVKQTFRARNMASDAMDTGAACRTFSVLLSESRGVTALLFPV